MRSVLLGAWLHAYIFFLLCFMYRFRNVLIPPLRRSTKLFLNRNKSEDMTVSKCRMKPRSEIIINEDSFVTLKKNQKRESDLSELKSSPKLAHFYFAPLVRFYTPIGKELSCAAAYSYLLHKFSTRTAQNCFISTPFPIGTQAICHDKGVSTFSSHTTLLQAVTSLVLSTRQRRTTQQTETLGV